MVWFIQSQVVSDGITSLKILQQFRSNGVKQSRIPHPNLATVPSKLLEWETDPLDSYIGT